MKGIPRLVLLLLGILIIGSFLLLIGRPESSTYPSADSFQPSGLRAFRELLAENGYSSRLNTRARIQVEEGEILVIPRFFATRGESQNSGAPSLYDTSLAKILSEGHDAIILSVPSDFPKTPPKAERATVAVEVDSATKTFQVSFGRSIFRDLNTGILRASEIFDIYQSLSIQSEASIPVASAYKVPLVWLAKVNYKNGKSSTVLWFQPGVLATNRFIDQDQNASLLLASIKSMAPKGSRFVFLEAAFGNYAEPGLLGTIGPWAVFAGWQFVFVFAIVVFTLGQRFGLPSEGHAKQKAARELVHALSGIYRRAKSTHGALEIIYLDARRTLLNVLKLPSDTSDARLAERLPDSLVRALTQVEVATKQRVPEEVALSLVRRLESEMALFLPSHYRRRR